ncbi:hypothetical protein D3C81_657700 [compost metagenome]
MGVGIRRTRPSTCGRDIQPIVLGRRLVLHQYPVAGDQGDTVEGLEACQRDIGCGGHPHRLLAVEFIQLLQDLGVDVGTGRENHAGVDLQFDVAGVADDHVYTHDLRTA